MPNFNIAKTQGMSEALYVSKSLDWKANGVRTTKYLEQS